MENVVAPLVIIESPFSAETPTERRKYRSYLRRAINHSISLGEAPFASHGFYTSYLSDTDPDQRRLGMLLGFRWASKANLIAVYADHGLSSGMLEGLAIASAYKIPTSFRYLLAR